jgi:hypothetical protein
MLAELGEERANALVRKALGDVYRRLGEQWWRAKQSRHVGENMTLAFASFAKGDALNYSVRAESDDAFEIDVTGCRYAQFYKELGEPETRILAGLQLGLPVRGGFGLRHKAHAHTNHHARREPLRFSLQATKRLTASIGSQIARRITALILLRRTSSEIWHEVSVPPRSGYGCFQGHCERVVSVVDL